MRRVPILLAIGLFACGDNTAPTPLPPGTFEAEISGLGARAGQAYFATTDEAFVLTLAPGSGPQGRIEFSRTADGTPTPRYYNLSIDHVGSQFTGAYYDSTASLYGAILGGGGFKVSEVTDSVVAGTFDFHAYNLSHPERDTLRIRGRFEARAWTP